MAMDRREMLRALAVIGGAGIVGVGAAEMGTRAAERKRKVDLPNLLPWEHGSLDALNSYLDQIARPLFQRVQQPYRETGVWKFTGFIPRQDSTELVAHWLGVRWRGEKLLSLYRSTLYKDYHVASQYEQGHCFDIHEGRLFTIDDLALGGVEVVLPAFWASYKALLRML